MSILVMSHVWKHGPEAQGELLVLLALADYADDDGGCWPSMASVARKARMTERGARKNVAKLRDAGWISVDEGGGRHGCNRYIVALEKVQDPAQETRNEVPPRNDVPPEHGDRNPELCDIKPGTPVPPNRQEPSKNRHTLDDAGFDAFWDACPRKVGKGAARKAYAKAAKNADPEAILDGMVRHSRMVAGTEAHFIPHPATWLNAERWADEDQPRAIPQQYTPGKPRPHWMVMRDRAANEGAR